MSRMHIAINCRSFLTATPTGIGRYSRNLTDHLSRVDAANDYSLYSPKGFFDRKRRLPKAPGSNFHVRPDYCSFGVEAVCGRVDVYHAPSPEVIRTGPRVKVVVTVHDLVHKVFPQTQTLQTTVLSNAAMDSIVQHATRFICISESTRKDLEKFYPSTSGRACVVYNGFDKTLFYEMDEAEKGVARAILDGLGVKEKFLLFVGTLEPRKNLNNLLQAFAGIKSRGIFNGKLVVAGMKGWMMESFDQLAADLGIGGDVISLGYLTDHELRYLYGLCEVFVFPSLYEGFGFPILEAMACGAPVVTSNVSSCAEVGHGAALMVPPSDPDAIAAAIERIVTDSAFAVETRRRSLARAQDFSFEKMARETLGVYEGLFERTV